MSSGKLSHPFSLSRHRRDSGLSFPSIILQPPSDHGQSVERLESNDLTTSTLVHELTDSFEQISDSCEGTNDQQIIDDSVDRSFWDPNLTPSNNLPLPTPMNSFTPSSSSITAPHDLSNSEKRKDGFIENDQLSCGNHQSSTLSYNSNDTNFPDSPYPEVQSSVFPIDDSSLQVSTVRAWFLGLLFSIVLPAINQFFFYRYPGVIITGIVAQLVAHPLGLGLAQLPRGREDGFWRWINPCPWNVKEHTLVFIMANVSASSAYATNLVAVQRFFYNQRWGWGYQLMLVLGTQLLGFSFSGYLQRFLVRPASMIWPSTLVNTALFNALHIPPGNDGPLPGRTAKSRQMFFYLNAGAMFIWSFLPEYLFTALSNFDWVTWIKPKNQVINLLFGYQSGAGFSLLTFDWGMAAAFNNPLATPWWTTGNILAGFIFFIWFLAPVLYYTNTFYAKYMPFSTSEIFDNTAQAYNVTKVLTREMTFDLDGYKAYSPVYLPITYAICYGLSFAAITATIVHCILFYRRQVWHQAFNKSPPVTDIHATLMSKYPKVPHWWYTILFLSTLSISIAAIRAWPTELPVWALFLAIAVGAVMVLPIGIIQAVTNLQIPLNFATEMLIGAAVPGKPVALMLFKTFGYISTTQALCFVHDQKLAHYMKLPPRTVFISQVIAATIGSIVQLGVQEWLFANVNGICQMNTEAWWCPSTQTFFSSSVLYGLIGPNRLFGPKHLYTPLLLFFPLGAVLPLITYFLARKYPTRFWRYVNWPVIFSGIGLIPPFLPINFIAFCFMGFIFQFWIRRRHFVWWSRYNYILSAAWTCGYALCIIIIFFCLQLPKNGNIGKSVQQWWGNVVYSNTLDGKGGDGAAALHLSSGETFGLSTGSWS